MTQEMLYLEFMDFKEGSLSKRTIEAAEKGERVLLNTLGLLAKFFQVEVEELLLSTPPRQKPKIRWPQVWLGDLPRPGTSIFVGREAELAMLDDAWKDDACHVLVITGGWGGGKSTLVHQWLKQMDTESYRGAEWVVGWSFRGQGLSDHAGGDNFFPKVLTYFDDPNPDSGLEEGQAIRLTKVVRGHRTLVILDGLEPLQNPPSPDEEWGRITNAAVRALILNLTSQMNGLCVITSRYPVWDLKDQVNNGPEARVREIRLQPLALQAAIHLLKSRHLHGPEDEFANAAWAYRMHPLSLSVLAGVLERRFQANIARWREAPGGDKSINGILAALEVLLSDKEKSVMNMLGLFDGPANGKAIDSLRAGHPISGLTDGLKQLDDGEWSAVLQKLRDLQLLAEANEERPADLECHPEVRAYFARQLREKTWNTYRRGQDRLYKHFTKVSASGGIDDFYLAIAHGCEAGRHAEVFEEIIWEKMNARFAFKWLNGYGAGTQELLTLNRFFRAPFDPAQLRPIKGIDDLKKSCLFIWAATVLFVLGRVEDSIKFADHALRAFKQAKDWLSVCCSTAYLCWFVAARGDIRDAMRLSDECIEQLDKHWRQLTKEQYWKKIALGLKASLVAYTGNFDEAWTTYEDAREMECDIPEAFTMVWQILMFHYACLLLMLKHYEAAEREAEVMIEQGRCGNPVLGFLGHQIMGRMELAKVTDASRGRLRSGKKALLNLARKQLAEASDYLDHCPAQDQTIVSALYMAQLCRMAGDLDEAASWLKRAEDSVGSFVLLKTDCLLERAWLCLLQGDRTKASDALASARNLIEKHDYHCKDAEVRELESELKNAWRRADSSL
jgi:tetratricopeptide (TPR) repeat protein